ncbi:MAG TPA: 6-carboxytetrahydropterin synthase [Xanthobacteraceae bacterium]|nr:6-carboxytetrahydropterin synthase [Xanthobacteraceae bacterium]
MWEIVKSFRFEAAHSLAGTTLGADAEQVHGHSFRAEVALRGTPDPVTGMVRDFGALDGELAAIRRTLDHRMLNRIAGLETPTLETLARYIFDRLRPVGKNLARVTVYRDSCGEACSYFGEAP